MLPKLRNNSQSIIPPDVEWAFAGGSGATTNAGADALGRAGLRLPRLGPLDPSSPGVIPCMYVAHVRRDQSDSLEFPASLFIHSFIHLLPERVWGTLENASGDGRGGDRTTARVRRTGAGLKKLRVLHDCFLSMLLLLLLSLFRAVRI